MASKTVKLAEPIRWHHGMIARGGQDGLDSVHRFVRGLVFELNADLGAINNLKLTEIEFWADAWAQHSKERDKR
jgi:hypothetical protein